MRVAGVEGEHDDLPLGAVQRHQGLTELLAVRRFVGRFAHLVPGHGLECGLPLPPGAGGDRPDPVDRPAAGDHHDPRHHAALGRIVTVGVLPYFGENILRDLLRL
jgi:hypothetical protein